MTISTLFKEDLSLVVNEAASHLYLLMQGRLYGSKEIQRGKELLLLIEEAQKMEAPDGKEVEVREAYRAVRRAFFAERVSYGEVGWKEWNGAVNKEFQAMLSPAFMQKVRAVRETLERFFLEGPWSVSKESMKEACRFFVELSRYMRSGA